MSEFSWKDDQPEQKKRGLPALLALIPPEWRVPAAFVGLALLFLSGSAVVFREESSAPADAARLSDLTAPERLARRSALSSARSPAAPSAASVPVKESPLPLPGILKHGLTKDDADKAGTKGPPGAPGANGGKELSADRGKGGNEDGSPDELQAGEDGGTPGFGGSREVKGSLLNGSASNGRIISRLSGAFAWGSQAKISPGGSRSASSKSRGVKPGRTKSGTYTGAVGGKTCEANIKDHPELKPMWEQLGQKRAALNDNGCGNAPCRACRGSSNACKCTEMRCEADSLYSKINVILCSKSTAQAAQGPGIIDTPPPICASNGSCDAAAPACGLTTSGVDNCGQACTKTGAACCVPDGSCDASPACGTTATGKDNCGGSCTRTGSACPPPPPPCVSDGSCTAAPTTCGKTTTGVDNCGTACTRAGTLSDGSCSAAPACGKTASGTDNCGKACTKTGPACRYACGTNCIGCPGGTTVTITGGTSCTSETTTHCCPDMSGKVTLSCTLTNSCVPGCQYGTCTTTNTLLPSGMKGK